MPITDDLIFEQILRRVVREELARALPQRVAWAEHDGEPPPDSA